MGGSCPKVPLRRLKRASEHTMQVDLFSLVWESRGCSVGPCLRLPQPIPLPKLVPYH